MPIEAANVTNYTKMLISLVPQSNSLTSFKPLSTPLSLLERWLGQKSEKKGWIDKQKDR